MPLSHVLKRLLIPALLAVAWSSAARAQSERANPALEGARLRQLEKINQARRAAGALPVNLDPAAGEFATLRARDAAENAFRGHWNRAGYTPWMHWGLVGGRDHINENTHASWSRTTGAPVDPSVCDMQNEDMIAAAMARGLDMFLAEGPGAGVYAAIVYYAPFPEPMTAAELNSKSSYHDFTDDQVADLWPWDLEINAKTQTFSVPVTVNREGLYYVQLYVRDNVGEFPLKKPVRTSTRDLTCAGGVVLSVGRALAVSSLPGAQ